jgi:ankyrin repeat protein
MRADVNGGMPNGATPLAIAGLQDDLAVVQCLVVDLGADVNQAMQPDGRMPLSIAARMDNVVVVRCLVKLGAEIGAVDIYGDGALLESARDGQCGTMQYLLEEEGADMDDVNNYSKTV